MKLDMVLFIVFLVLKLVGVIDWSWWLVTLPLWIGFALVGAMFAFSMVLIAIIKINKIITGRK